MEKKIIKLNVTSATGSENVLFSFEHPYIFKNLINILKREGVDVAIKPVPILNGLIYIPTIYDVGNVQLILRYNRNSFIQDGIAQLLSPVLRNVVMNKVDGATLRDMIYDFFAALLTILNPFSYAEGMKAAESCRSWIEADEDKLKNAGFIPFAAQQKA